MHVITFLLELLLEGLIFLRNYVFFPQDGTTFSLLRIFSLLIAFSISGAIVVFMSQGAILRHMGPSAKKLKAYGVASVSGIILAVCSCSVLPMFASIRKKGAGLGPAVAFLFSGPAINVLALSLTFSDIGPDIALARVIGAILLSIVIGFTLYVIFRKGEVKQANNTLFERFDEETRLKAYQKILFFLTLFFILIFGVYRPLPTLILLVLLGIQIVLFFRKDDLIAWGAETLDLAKKILPLFIMGVFIAGIISSLISEEMLARVVGQNTYQANLIASVIGALMYFATLTEVPIVSTLLANGMNRGPATALLLAGPSLSIPNMIIIGKVLGIKRTLTYLGLVVVLSALVGLVSGYIIYAL